jgi:hypothetical protein
MIYKRPDSISISDEKYIEKYGNIKNAKGKLFNIGAGSWEHKFWSNLDLPAQTEAYAAIQAPCISVDLVKDEKLPIDSNSVDLFYCSHVIEHLPEKDVQKMFNEAYRCLTKGGCIRIVTGPTAELDLDALKRGDTDWWFWMDDNDFIQSLDKELPKMEIYDRWLHHIATPRSIYSNSICDKKYNAKEIRELIEANIDNPEKLFDLLTKEIPFNINSPENHISWWHFEKLKMYFENAGFSTIVKSAFGKSTSKFMRDLAYFDQTYPQISVYVEAIK